MGGTVVFYSEDTRGFADFLLALLRGAGVDCLCQSGEDASLSRVSGADIFVFLCGASGKAPTEGLLNELSGEKRAGWRKCELLLVYSGEVPPVCPDSCGISFVPEKGAAEMILSLQSAATPKTRSRGNSLNIYGMELGADERWLDLSKRDICALDALMPLKKLEILFLQKNRIIELEPLAGLEGLLVLFLFNNRISDISPLSGLRRLGILYLFGNNISDISSLKALGELSDLRLSLNDISDISALSGLYKLKTLHLWGNRIADISALSGLSQLTELNLSDNKISDISALSKLQALQKLDLSDNAVSDTKPLIYLRSLQELKLAGNPIGAGAFERLRRALPNCRIY